MKKIFLLCGAVFLLLLVWAFSRGNNPWPKELANSNTMFVPYGGDIKSIDPADSYFEHEGTILDSIVEMPLEYDYEKRPYQLRPMLLEALPEPCYKDGQGRVLPKDAPTAQIARVEYLCRVKKGILYQPHPCFAADPKIPASARSPWEIAGSGTRELKSMDFKVGLARVCDPSIASPVFSMLSSFLPGMEECSKEIARGGESVDYRKVSLQCIEVLDDYTFRVILKRKYPQALAWMAMHFFSPVPYEAVEFYRRPEVRKCDLSMKNWPVGTGPYLLKKHIPNAELILERNPNYDRCAQNSQEKTPYIDRVFFFYERETVPCWIKFLQGYYDLSGLPNDAYDAAVSLSPEGSIGLSDKMQKAGIRMARSVRLVSYYHGFNMLDPVVGGLSEQKKKLRRAISIVLDAQEEANIFYSGRAVASHSILPPDIFGGEITKEHFNHYLFDWDAKGNRPIRKSLEEARRLMAEAGYPNGIGPDGKRLALNYDHAAAGMAGFKSHFLWMKNKFASIGIELIDNGTDLNRLRDKISSGNFQIATKGWVADYPDPENFFAIFYSKNAHVPTGGRGANYCNYQSPAFDRLFEKLETMENGPERLKLIHEALDVLEADAPCVWDFHPESYALVHPWLQNYIPHEVGKTFLRLRKLDYDMRAKRR